MSTVNRTERGTFEKKAFLNSVANTSSEVINLENESQIYSSKDVAKRLSIEPVTVRKYSQMLEEKGYCFKKDEKGWRYYNEDDIRYLEYLVNMKLMGKSLEESVKHVASLYRANLSIAQPDTSLQEEEKNPFLQFIKSQEEFNKKILEQLEIQEKKQAERDKNLMAALRESKEVKKQIAAAAEKKRWKWWKFWK